MGVLFLVGMVACIAGICRLFQVLVRWSFEATRRTGWGVRRRRTTGPQQVPDTVPEEWVSAYRSEQGG